jgi:hypothetical protein
MANVPRSSTYQGVISNTSNTLSALSAQAIRDVIIENNVQGNHKGILIRLVHSAGQQM